MKEQYIVSGYNITTNPQFQNKQFGITPELDKQLEQLAIECQNSKNKKIIDQLIKLIIEYPLLPMLKNYLSVAYNVQGNYEKAIEVNRWILAEHPGYLFAKLNQANVYIDEGEYDKVREILGEEMEIKQLYPEREVFHLAEVTGFLKLAVRYYAAIENIELAENRLELLKKIAPDHPDTEQASRLMLPLYLKMADNRWEKEKEQQIVLKTVKSKQVSSQTEVPQFYHPEITSLYQYGLKIPHEKLMEILGLPRETLIADLEKVIRDSEVRYDYFVGLKETEETHSFLLHALFLLAEINSVESLPGILSLLELDYEFLDFWLGDHKTATLWQCLYRLGINNTGLFREFLMKPGIDTFSKTAVSETLCQMVLHHPERREEILAIYIEMFSLFAEATPEDNLVDSNFLGLAVGDAIDCQLPELLPIIKVLFENEYVAIGINGDYAKVEKLMSKDSGYNSKRNIYTIYELYDHVLNTWAGYNENKNDYSKIRSLQQPVVSEKIGRNDACPCGSGLKYKKCCGK